jgi:hypothetical protein
MTESAYAWYREMRKIDSAMAYYGLPGDIIVSGTSVLIANANREVSITAFTGGGPSFRVTLRGPVPDTTISTKTLDKKTKAAVFCWLLQGLR